VGRDFSVCMKYRNLADPTQRNHSSAVRQHAALLATDGRELRPRGPATRPDRRTWLGVPPPRVVEGDVILCARRLERDARGE
jgi:hypothetical protein